MNVANENFKRAIARLAQDVDPARFEQRRWDAAEGAILDSAVHMAVEAIKEDGTFDPEQTATDKRELRQITLVHINRDEPIAHIHLRLAGDHLFLSAYPIEGSRGRVLEADPEILSASMLNAHALEEALAKVVWRIKIEG